MVAHSWIEYMHNAKTRKGNLKPCEQRGFLLQLSQILLHNKVVMHFTVAKINNDINQMPFHCNIVIEKYNQVSLLNSGI